MVEEQVDVVVLVADIEAMLPADEGEALSELDQEFLQMTDERGLEFALMEWLGEGEEVEDVGVLERLQYEVRLRRGEHGGEVGDGFALPDVRACADLQAESVAAPAVGEGLLHVPAAGGEVGDLVHENDVMSPRHRPEKRLLQKCHRLWHFCRSDRSRRDPVRVVAVERQHPLDVPLGEALECG